MVCDGQIDIATAQQAFAADWIAAYQTYYEKRKSPVSQRPPSPLPNPACLIKGNVNTKGERIYHKPGDRDYDRVVVKDCDQGVCAKGKRWFCSDAEAEAAGWRRARHNNAARIIVEISGVHPSNNLSLPSVNLIPLSHVIGTTNPLEIWAGDPALFARLASAAQWPDIWEVTTMANIGEEYRQPSPCALGAGPARWCGYLGHRWDRRGALTKPMGGLPCRRPVKIRPVNQAVSDGAELRLATSGGRSPKQER